MFFEIPRRNGDLTSIKDLGSPITTGVDNHTRKSVKQPFCQITSAFGRLHREVSRETLFFKTGKWIGKVQNWGPISWTGDRVDIQEPEAV